MAELWFGVGGGRGWRRRVSKPINHSKGAARGENCWCCPKEATLGAGSVTVLGTSGGEVEESSRERDSYRLQGGVGHSQSFERFQVSKADSSTEISSFRQFLNPNLCNVQTPCTSRSLPFNLPCPRWCLELQASPARAQVLLGSAPLAVRGGGALCLHSRPPHPLTSRLSAPRWHAARSFQRGKAEWGMAAKLSLQAASHQLPWAEQNQHLLKLMKVNLKWPPKNSRLCPPS